MGGSEKLSTTFVEIVDNYVKNHRGDTFLSMNLMLYLCKKIEDENARDILYIVEFDEGTFVRYHP